jgi:HEAT repeat protein
VHWLQSEDATDRYRAQSAIHLAGIAALCRAIDDPSVEARRAALAALARLRAGHRHTAAKVRDRLANDPDDEVRGSAARYLAEVDNERFEVLKLLHAKLMDPRAGYWTRLGAADGVTRIATSLGTGRVLTAVPSIIDTLETVLTDRYSTVRTRAIEALAAIGGPRVPDLVAWLVYDRDPSVRATAVSTLVALRVPGALATACAVLREDPSYFVRESAARALAGYDDALAADALRAALNDVHEFVRGEATRSLTVVLAARGEKWR